MRLDVVCNNNLNEQELLEDICQVYGGECNPIEYGVLWNLAKEFSLKGVMVEIGSKFGVSSVILSKASQLVNGGKLISIDYSTLDFDKTFFSAIQQDKVFVNYEGWNRLQGYFKNIHRYCVEDRIISIVAKSQEIIEYLNVPISLLFIDGSHAYNDVKDDWLLYSQMVIDGGVVIFHDYVEEVNDNQVETVHDVVKEFVETDDNFVCLPEYCQKGLYVVARRTKMISDKNEKILISFDGNYISKNMAANSRGRYALYMAEALSGMGYEVHLYNSSGNFWQYRDGAVLVNVGDFAEYERIISFSDVGEHHKDCSDEMFEAMKYLPSDKLYLATHCDRAYPGAKQISWSKIITWTDDCRHNIWNEFQEEWPNVKEIVTWYPGLKIAEAKEKNLILATVRYAYDAAITLALMAELRKYFNYQCYAIHAPFFSNDAAGIEMFMKMQRTGYIHILAKLPHPSFLDILSRSVLYLEPTSNAPIWNPAEALINGAIAIRPVNQDEYLRNKNPFSLSGFNNIEESEISDLSCMVSNAIKSEKQRPLVDEMRLLFNFGQQQQRLLEILEL